MKTNLCYLFFLLKFTVGFGQITNNTCATATALTYNASECTNGSNTGATATVASDGIPASPDSDGSCVNGGATDYNNSVFYSVTLPIGQTNLVTSVVPDTLSTANTVIILYSGTCGSLTRIGCSVGTGVLSTTGLSAGSTYYIMVEGKGSNVGNFCISAAAIATNDNLCNAINLTVGSGCINGNNVSTTAEAGETDAPCYGGSPNTINSVWYKFTPTDDSITVNFGGGSLGTKISSAVYSSSNNLCSGVMTSVGCTNNGSEIDLTALDLTKTYFIMVDAKSTDVGTFCISIYETPPPPPPIGTCLNPRNLYVGSDCNNVQGLQYDEQNNILSTNTATGGDAGASMSGGSYTNTIEQTCAGTDVGAGLQGYWVEFTATGTTNTVFNNAGTVGYDYTIFTGSDCAALIAQQCFTVAAGGTKTVGSTAGAGDDLVIGTTYKVLITPASTSTTTTAFLCLTGTPYVPPNNNCSNATVLEFGEAYTLNNSNATVDNNNTLCSGSTENNIWVKYTATYTGTAYVFLQDQDCACGNGIQMSIYNAGASCPNNSSTCSSYINPNNDNDFSGTISVTNGSTYYIQLDGYAGCACTFNLCLNSVNSADCSILLPVEMNEIEAFFTNVNEVKVLWSTLSERDCDYFLLEQSSDGINYKEVGRIKGNGTTLNKHYYYLNDNNPFKEGVSYYRIKQFDYNGTGKTYKPVSVSPNKHKEIYFYPNPTEAQLKVEIPGHTGKVEIEIYSHLGKKVFSYAVEDNSDFFLLDLENLDAGNYIIRVISESKVYTDRIGIK